MDKVFEILKKNLIALLLSVGVLCWTFVKDVFITGAEVKSQQAFITMLKCNESRKFIYHISDSAINNTMKNPVVWLEVLGSTHIGDYTKKKSEELREAVYKDIIKKDSLKGDMVHSLGEGSGIRNDEVILELTKLLKAFKEGKLYISRTVRANF